VEEHPPPVLIDGADKLCVTLLLELRDRIQGLPAGTLVHLIATDPAAPIDLPAWCHLTGHQYLGPLQDVQPPTYVLRLTATAHATDPAKPWHRRI
jgi:tRNA 2-thiouridine synthesizing protein A